MAAEDISSEFDRLSNLPEILLCSNILSRLPIDCAVRSSLLARKWRYLWTKIPHLHFSAFFFRQLDLYSEATMEHILSQHDAPLESFRLHIPKSIGRYGMDIGQCIQYAVKKRVKRMALKVKSDYPKIDLPLSIFSCTTLVGLKLSGLKIPQIPTPSENFLSLNTCYLCEISNLTDPGLQRLVELCPLLQELVLVECEELTHLKIQAPNLNYLTVERCYHVESLTADCPQLLQLKKMGCSKLAVLEINSLSLVELKLRDCYELSRLQVNSCVFLKEAESLEGLSLEGQLTVESLRKLSLRRPLPLHRYLRGRGSHRSREACSSGLFGTFPDLEELKVSSCMMGIAGGARGHEQASRQMELVSDFAFPNLKNVFVDISSHTIEKELSMLGFLLRNAPSLKTMTLVLPFCFEDMDDWEFEDHVLGLQRASADVEIKILENDDEEDEEEYYEKYEHENESPETGSPGWDPENDYPENDLNDMGPERGWEDEEYENPYKDWEYNMEICRPNFLEDDHDYEYYRGRGP